MRTLYLASEVLTLSYPPVGEWLLIDGRHVQRVGTGEAPQADRIVELPGTSILPGFIDTHVHLTGTGIHHASPELSRARSAADVVAVVRKLAGEGDEPFLIHGYDESKWPDTRLPTVEELDGATRRPLLVIRVDGHASLANTVALEATGAAEEPGMERDDAGAPTGFITREANNRVRRWFNRHLSDHDIQQHQLRAAALAASRGVTCVHEMSMPSERDLRDLEVLLGHRARLPVDVVTYVASTDIPQVMDLRFGQIGGDLAIDGSIGARTACLSRPYTDGEGNGAAYYPDDELAEFLHNAHLAGLQAGVHAIGDGAIEQLLSVWERVYRALDSRERRHFRARRHRVEHFEMPSPQQIEKAAMLGLAVSIQPCFDAEWGHPGGLYDVRLGWDRASGMNPFRSLLDRGIEVGVGSDSPITDLDPMAAIEALENHHDPAQRVWRGEAIRLATVGSARLAHQEDKKGSLEPGKHADFAAYESDPLTAGSVVGLRPILTVSLGREVYAS